MDRAGSLLSMLATTALVVSGAVLGWLNPGEGSRITAAFGFAIGGLMVAAYLRVVVFHILLPVWRRVTFTTQAGWTALQAGFALMGLWLGMSVDLGPGETRAFYVVLGPAFGFGMGLAATALWAWSHDLLRYTLPRLLGRGLQKVRGRHPV